MKIRVTGRCLLALVLFLAAGCAGIPADRGAQKLALVTAQRTGLPAARLVPAAAPLPPVSGTLTPDTALRIALTRNPALLALYARLGIAEADVYDAARLANPLLSLEALDGSAGSTRVTLGLVQNLAGLLRLTPARRRTEAARAETHDAVAAALVALAGKVEAAYWRHAGALAKRALRESIAQAAEATASLAERMLAAGNLPLRAALEARVDASRADLEVTRATADAAHTRAALAVLLGDDAQTGTWDIPGELRQPAPSEPAVPDLEALAANHRYELAAAAQRVQAGQAALLEHWGLRGWGTLAGGIMREREVDGSVLQGPSVSFSVPVWNQGDGRRLRAVAALESAQADLRMQQLAIGAEVRTAHARLLAARARALRHRDQILPIRSTIVAEARREYAFMLSGQFDLLATRQAYFDACETYLVALTDYAVARAELAAAVGTRLAATGPPLSARALTAPSGMPADRHAPLRR